MTSNKTLCRIHMFHYSGLKCPFCEQERIQRMSKAFEAKCKDFNETQVKPENKEEHAAEVTASQLEVLKAKFNSR